MGINSAENIDLKWNGLFDSSRGSGQIVGGVVTVCAICVIMLIANILRRKIPFLRRSLMPTAVIAGILGLMAKEIIRLTLGFNIFNEVTLDALVYHALPIGFIALCLRDKDDYAFEQSKSSRKIERVNAAKSGSLIISTYLMQALVGVGITVLFYKLVNPASGLMLPLGFGQGPQQSAATGGIWEDKYPEIWSAGLAKNFGITVAALGFLWASIPSIFLINRIAKKKGLTIKRGEFQKSGDLNSYSIEGSDEIPLSESIDKFTLQICMVLGIYLITIGIIIGIEALLRLSNIDFLINFIPTIWGFSFMIAVLVSLLTKTILRKLVKTGVMHRKYPNSYMMNRIGGAAFDISITAALFMIAITELGQMWIPILVMTTVGGFASIFYLRYLCNRIYKDYKDEAFLAMYGMLTGTIANGMILLREIDTNFATPAGDDLVNGSSTAIVLGLPLLFLIQGAPGQGNLWWTMLVIGLYFGALSIYNMGWHKKLFKHKSKTIIENDVENPQE